jgi:hypothetical protein
LGRHRCGVTGIALKNLDGNGASFAIGQQANDDLQFVPLAVAGVAVLGQRAAVTFEVRRGDVVQDQASVGQMAFGQGILDGRLPIEQPIHCRIALVLVGIFDPE